jgi:hypothetical protein
MNRREAAAAAAIALLGALGFTAGLLASDAGTAVLAGLLTVGVTTLGAALVGLQRLRRSVHDQEALLQARLQVDRDRLAEARALTREHRQTARVARKTAKRVASLESSSRRMSGAVATIQRALAPTPAPPAVTGDDLSTPGTRALSDLAFDGATPSVVLLLQSFSSQVLFAGIRTAALTAVELAGSLGRPLRVIVFEDIPGDPQAALESFRELVKSESRYPHLADTLRLSSTSARDHRGHHADDIWVATFWTTAWNLIRLVDEKRISVDNVVYVVQDWEPGFYPWGDLRLKARSTYDAGFQLLVNSRPLARYVEDHSGCRVDSTRVFAPELDPGPLRVASDRWKPSPDGSLRVFFYARPSKPRNMLNLGLQALRAWSLTFEDDHDVLVRLAGEPLGEVDLGPRLRTEVLGKLSYDAYYDVLAETDLGLALMSSPHPGHLALELPMAGIPTVTNQFEGYREPWVSGLVVAERADPLAIADALKSAASVASSLESHAPGVLERDLGVSLVGAMAAVADGLRAI